MISLILLTFSSPPANHLTVVPNKVFSISFSQSDKIDVVSFIYNFSVNEQESNVVVREAVIFMLCVNIIAFKYRLIYSTEKVGHKKRVHFTPNSLLSAHPE